MPADPKTEELIGRLIPFVPPLPLFEQRLSLAIIRELAEAHPVSEERLAASVGAPPSAIERVVESWTGVVRDETGRITGYWGFGLEPTPHRLEVGNARLYAWGAWDVLFLPELVGQDVRVSSSCPTCDEPISLEVRRDGAVSADPAVVLSFLLPPEGTPLHETDMDDYCRFVHFFPNSAAGESWCRRHPETFLITPEQGVLLGGVKNHLRYPDLLRSH